MYMEYTLSIVKPNAVKKNVIGNIFAQFEQHGLRIVAIKMVQLSLSRAQDFYCEHAQKPFYNKLCDFMSSGPICVQVLQGVNAIEVNRQIMGATDPNQAEAGTIRARYGDSLDENSVHGSDSPTSAQREIQFFFEPEEILVR
ncbi:MAG: nucleoside-diphosphate kinase [Gammaproteobacteria bacterium]|nr:nucleoside-diphosphate kinase [Gammaproteobacteria bacterium]MDE0251784.1 nucleoside-diphosphate kinase [Gammaproteobacteria bacterium]MDE0403207.1 nucleoside-diphosphate kinase [Gammaproteobacteria bacterium]